MRNTIRVGDSSDAAATVGNIVTEVTVAGPRPAADGDVVSTTSTSQVSYRSEFESLQRRLLEDLRSQSVESRLEFVSREISHIQTLSSALVEEAQRLQINRHIEVAELISKDDTATVGATSAFRSSYSIQLAPLSLPRTLPLWDTVCCRIFGPKIALRMHLSVGVLGNWMNAQDTIFVLLGILIGLLVLFDILPRPLSWLSFIFFLLSFLTAPLHCNWPIAMLILRTFDFWFLLAHILFSFYFLLPDLCGWDSRTAIWFGWGSVGFTGLLVDAAPTRDAQQGYIASWGGVVLSMVTIGVAVQKQLFHEIHPRTIDFAITSLPTQGALLSSFGTVIVWGIKFIITSMISPGRGLLLRLPLQRSDLAHDIAKATLETDKLIDGSRMVQVVPVQDETMEVEHTIQSSVVEEIPLEPLT